MTDLLLRLFVKHASDTSDPAVRAGYGRLAGVTGIVCNLLLFALKLLAGTISGSVSITADAVNNLSDASGSIVTLVGFKLASRPADDEHPYGHARMEYLSGLAVAVLILVIGVELVKSSIGKILHPEAVEFSALIVVILVCSILVKLWMAVFNRKLGRRIGSAALTAAAADSRNDVISTGAVLLACIVGQLTGLKIDGYVGLLVALFILWSGVGIAKDTIDPLIGAKPDESLVHAIACLMTSHPSILGIHDLMVHDYGPGRRFASVHAAGQARSARRSGHPLRPHRDRRSGGHSRAYARDADPPRHRPAAVHPRFPYGLRPASRERDLRHGHPGGIRGQDRAAAPRDRSAAAGWEKGLPPRHHLRHGSLQQDDEGSAGLITTKAP